MRSVWLERAEGRRVAAHIELVLTSLRILSCHHFDARNVHDDTKAILPPRVIFKRYLTILASGARSAQSGRKPLLSAYKARHVLRRQWLVARKEDCNDSSLTLESARPGYGRSWNIRYIAYYNGSRYAVSPGQLLQIGILHSQGIEPDAGEFHSTTWGTELAAEELLRFVYVQ